MPPKKTKIDTPKNPIYPCFKCKNFSKEETSVDCSCKESREEFWDDVQGFTTKKDGTTVICGAFSPK